MNLRDRIRARRERRRNMTAEERDARDARRRERRRAWRNGIVSALGIAAAVVEHALADNNEGR